jgi:putative hydrolase of the HAD superfamily
MDDKITTIVFDYGGVISLSQNSNHIDAICEILNIDVSEFRSVYQKNRNDYDSGIISAEDYWHTVISNIDINKSISDNDLYEVIKHDVLSWSGINEDTVRLIQMLYENKYNLAILSNMTFDTLDYLNKEAEWMKYFNVKVFSCEEKICKPDNAIYKTLLTRLSENSSNVLFIDDYIVNIDAAQKLGINSIHYKNHIELIEEMKNKYGITIS